MHSVTSRCHNRLILVFCALVVSSSVAAADDLAALRAKAEQGDTESQFELGSMYFFGIGVSSDDREAARWYRKAAEQGHVTAQFNLGKAYLNGQGIPHNAREAVRWFRKAAEQEHVTARFYLGAAFRVGYGIQKNVEEAVHWFRKAAEQGHPRAQFNLGAAYRFGEGVPRNSQNAAEWYQKAAEQGDMLAQFNLGLSYTKGTGVPRNLQTAARWYQKAADQGLACAQNSLGVCHDNGTGVPRNPRTAVKWYHKATEQGDADAQFNLGLSYINGTGVLKNPRTAAQWFHKSAAQGDAAAQYNLGVLYSDGRGVPKTPQTAVRWYHRAAEQGYMLAQFNLGVSYFNGIGVPRNDISSYAWLNSAASQGYEAAKTLKSTLMRRMTTTQIGEALRLSRQLTARVVERKRQSPGGQSVPPDRGRAGTSAKLVTTGTGFFVTGDGHFVTSAHVIAGASRVQVLTRTGTLIARVVHSDTISDLALLKVSGTFKPLPVISSRPLREGTRVFTFGHPIPDIQGVDPVYASGNIRKLSGVQGDPGTLQISVPVQPGNAGGPLVNEYGNVVGVVVTRRNTQKLLKKPEVLPKDVHYAVKSSTLLLLLEQHIPEAAKKLKEGFPEKSRDLVSVQKEVKQATVLIRVERDR